MERLNFRTARILRGTMMGERASRKLRPSLDFSDHRPYASGDDFRYVDWQAYARHEDLFVKLGEAPQRINVHILLDASPSMAWAPSRDYIRTSSQSASERRLQATKWDTARRVAGALAYLGLASGERISITSFADTLNETFGPTQGKRQVTPTLQYLSDLIPASLRGNADGTITGLAHSLNDYARLRMNGGLLVIISDLIDNKPGKLVDSADALIEGLRHLIPPRWQVLVMHLMTTEEIQPSVMGDFDLQDIETDQFMPLHIDGDVLAQYSSRIEQWCAGLKAGCTRRGATYSRILAEWPLEKKVVPYLRQQGLLQ